MTCALSHLSHCKTLRRMMMEEGVAEAIKKKRCSGAVGKAEVLTTVVFQIRTQAARWSHKHVEDVSDTRCNLTDR